MCYNKMYAYEFPSVGCIAESKSGHDAGRLYTVVAVLGSNFVLAADGDYRPLDKPKTKRIKHLKPRGYSQELADAVQSGTSTDALIRKILKEFAAVK